jgi:hypothetical protein
MGAEQSASAQSIGGFDRLLWGLSRSLLNFVGQALPGGQTRRLWQPIQRCCWRRVRFGELPEPFAMPRAAYRP